MTGMVGTLVRLRMTIWRRTPNAMRPVGVTLGLALAGAALLVGTGDLGGRDSSADLLAVFLAGWLIGWVMGPIQTGGSDLLRPEWFAMAPIRTRRLAAALLTASGAGIGPAITVVALAAPVVFATRFGPAAVAVAVLAVPLVLMVMLLASRIVAEALGGAARSRLATEAAGLQYGLFIAATLVGWGIISILVDVAGDLGTGFSDLLPRWLATVVRVLPSGWGLVAVEAAGQGRWWLTAVALAGLAALAWLGLLLWARLLRQRLTGSRTGGSGGAVGVRTGGRRRLPASPLPVSPLGAVASKDLRSWLRDPRRGVEVRGALWAAVFSTAALWALVPEVLPFAGVLAALIGSMACVNVYAMDGTALWLTLGVPGSDRADVRGRQLAWLLIFGPASALLSAIGLAVEPSARSVPWVLALLPALLGGAAGLIPLLSVYGLAPETDAHRRTGNPAETGGDATGLYFATLFAAAATTTPAAVLLAAGQRQDEPLYSWLAVPVGVLTGLGCARWFGTLAANRLRDRGPELLQLMRTGPRPRTAADPADGELPRWQRAAFGTAVTLSAVALVPQALVPAAMKLTGNVAPVWFLALHVPGRWQWPVIAGMTAVGTGLGAATYRLYRKAQLSRSGTRR